MRRQLFVPLGSFVLEGKYKDIKGYKVVVDSLDDTIEGKTLQMAKWTLVRETFKDWEARERKMSDKPKIWIPGYITRDDCWEPVICHGHKIRSSCLKQRSKSGLRLISNRRRQM